MIYRIASRKSSQQKLTKDASCFVELTPANDGAHPAVLHFGVRGWQANGSDEVSKANWLFHSQHGNVVHEPGVDVARVNDDV